MDAAVRRESHIAKGIDDNLLYSICRNRMHICTHKRLLHFKDIACLFPGCVRTGTQLSAPLWMGLRGLPVHRPRNPGAATIFGPAQSAAGRGSRHRRRNDGPEQGSSCHIPPHMLRFNIPQPQIFIFYFEKARAMGY